MGLDSLALRLLRGDTMSANINTMFYTGKTPWHGLGTQVDKELTAADAIQAAGLNWTVSKEPIYFQNKAAQSWRKIPDQFATVRQDTMQALGVVGSVYKPLQNKDAFSFADSLIQEKAAVYHTAGALGSGEKIWVLAKLDGVCRIKGEDVVEKYLLLSNSHDGSSGVRICLTPIRVVCQNTLNQAITSADKIFKIRHTGSMGAKVGDARAALGMTNVFFEEFEKNAQALASKQVNGQLFNTYLESLGFDPESEGGRVKGQVETLTRLYESGQGQNMAGAHGTAWGAYNAVTEFLTHERATRVTDSYKSVQEARLNSLWFGASQSINAKAWDNALALLK